MKNFSMQKLKVFSFTNKSKKIKPVDVTGFIFNY